MVDGVIEQAIYGARDARGHDCLARSPGFLDDWRPAAERLCGNFGDRPAGVVCPACVFAQPFGDRQVAVVQAAGQSGAGALGFRLLILPADLYERLEGDPFSIADQFPPNWMARGDLSSLEWTEGPPPARTVEEVQKVLNVPHSSTLLGGVQALLEGERLVFERSSPDPRLLRGLWSLLPTGRRGGLWPASFAFANARGFDVLVVPRAHGPAFDGYLTEEQAGDYPEGAYELRLQTVVEAGDQKRMDDLFAGRTRGRWIRIAFLLCALAILNSPFILMFIKPPPSPPAPGARRPALPSADACPPLDDSERRQLADSLQQLARQQGIDVPHATTAAALTDSIEQIDRSLSGEPGRDPGRLRDLGPVQRQLRALLWKHGVADYDAPGLTPVEMVKKLHDKVGP